MQKQPSYTEWRPRLSEGLEEVTQWNSVEEKDISHILNEQMPLTENEVRLNPMHIDMTDKQKEIPEWGHEKNEWRPSEELNAVLEKDIGKTSHERISLIKSETPLNLTLMDKKQQGFPEWRPLKDSEIDGLQSFVFFVGWARSCSSIVGSLLDAHPNMIVAHEYFTFSKLVHRPELRNRSILFNKLYNRSYENAVEGCRTNKTTAKGYDFNMIGSWHGRFSNLKVIGDKAGRNSVQQLSKNGRKFYEQFRRDVKLPLKPLHVIRNPFDIIATTVLYMANSAPGKIAATPTNKFTDFNSLKRATQEIIQLSNDIMHMLPDLKLSPHQVYCDDLIADPIKTVSDICDYLEVECSAEYLQMCDDKIFKEPSMSRNLVTWDPKTLPSLTNDLKKFPFFSRYLD